MNTTTEHLPEVELPQGVDMACRWEGGAPAFRAVFGVDRYVTDSAARCYTFAYQLADGSVFDGTDPLRPPSIHVANGDSSTGLEFNSDQAREFASHLLEAAAELDRWVTK